ncbi:hypothetical protein DFJ74DRAFT_693219 [Hyaloraphidium curvatum]|nr:hypothetical protein DFJ74DRAFT_693219 [Hyaloraphidium curvatum]
MASPGFHVAVTPEKGRDERGIIADRAFSPGETILFEARPLVAAPFHWTAVYFPMCSHCCRSMERPDRMLARLAGVSADQVRLGCLHGFREHVMKENAASGADPVDAAAGFAFDPLNPVPVPCTSCPLETYCSPSCRQLAWDQHHRFLCPRKPIPGKDDPYVALVEMWKELHPPPEATTPMLVARIVCDIRGRMEAGASFAEAAAPFADFKRAPPGPVGDSAIYRLFLNTPNPAASSSSGRPNILEDVHAALVRLVDHPSLPRELVSFQAFLDLLGVVALNGQGVGTSALDNYRIFLGANPSPAASADLEAIDALAPFVEEVSAPFLRAEGSALYATHRFLNHSCDPNAECRFEGPGKGYEVRVVCKRPIALGEEVTIAYLEEGDEDEMGCGDSCADDHEHEWEDVDGDEAMDEGEDGEESEGDGDGEAAEERPGEERRRQLRKYYLFDCRCPLCIRELAE